MLRGSPPERLLSGQVAARCGISTDTLRHYERVGVIPPPSRSPAGYRLYPPEVCDRVRVVRAALGIGFTLAELAAVFHRRGRGEAPCREVRSLARAKLDDLEIRLAELGRLRDRLKELVADWDARLADRGAGEAAHLLESLADAPGRVGRSPHLPDRLTRGRNRKRGGDHR